MQRLLAGAMILTMIGGLCGGWTLLYADDELTEGAIADDTATQEVPAAAPPKKVLAKDPPGMKRLDPECNAWIDPKHKRVVVDGEVCLTEGQLEMLACIRGTKEHESIIAVECRAFVLHAALLAVGAQPGSPVQFRPTYKPASGTPIDITLVWTDASGVHRAKAQDWIKNNKTGKTLESTWVFSGSGFYEDEETKEKHYMAEGGDLICVSNFPTAMLDLPIESSQSNTALSFVAKTDAIPPRGTKVRLVLAPRLEEKKK
jgi:hypothetical protein